MLGVLLEGVPISQKRRVLLDKNVDVQKPTYPTVSGLQENHFCCGKSIKKQRWGLNVWMQKIIDSMNQMMLAIGGNP